MRIIIDTSSILFGFENGKSVFEAAREQLDRPTMVVSKGIINELRIISKKRSSKGRSALAALMEIEAKRIMVSAALGYPDNWIRTRALASRDVAVITNDTRLARSLPRHTRVLKLSRNGRLRPFAR